jgi:hypothetical protein
MTDNPEQPPPGMIGYPPSARGLSAIPADSAEHAVRVAREWRDVAETYARRRMREPGIPEEKIGASDPYRGKPWHTFDPDGTVGGNITTGITVNSGVLNPELLKGKKGGKLWVGARLRDRIDAVIAHEFEEDRQHARGGDQGSTEDRAADHGRGEADSEGDGAVASLHPISVQR